jgi:putative nucleotidyltransferase with HDIG domain
MSKIKNIFFKLHFFHIFILFITVAVITISSPREGKFKFEYQKGKPWLHEVLVAPFDFPIYKDEIELKAEKDSILNNFNPYFNYNPKIILNEKSKFRSFYNTYWKKYTTRYPKVLKEGEKELILSKIQGLLDFVYDKGIAELPEEFSVSAKQNLSIVLVRENVAEDIELDEIFTQSKAYAYITHELNAYSDKISTSTGINTDLFFKGLNIENYIKPNLFYDKTTSNTVKESKVNNISLTSGLIQSGSRIILTGDVVTPDIFKILESLRHEYESRMGSSANIFFLLSGQAILVFICFLLLFLYIKKFRRDIYDSNKRTAFIPFLMVIFIIIGSLTVKFSPANLYFVPFAVVAIIIKTFYDAKIAQLAHLITVLIVGFWAPNSFEFVLLNIIAGIVSVLSLTSLYKRGKLFFSAAWIIISYTLIYLGIVLYQEASWSNINPQTILLFAGNGLLVLSSVPLIYVFEKTFGFVSDASLLEISDTNQPLLRRLAEIAPGTFQHSLQVANLSEDAIFQIGGNPLLVRAGALYHDIGKIEKPAFFIENLTEGINPHEGLEFEKSVEIIVGHVYKGIEIAKEYKLPEQIVDFIRTHHGTSLVHYFYRSYLNKYPDSNVDINQFSYPGPKPFSREMAVVMMADSVEAASRSLKDYSDNVINTLVETIINFQLKEGQFNDTQITLKEVETIKAVFKRRLKNIYHIRIEYPSAT